MAPLAASPSFAAGDASRSGEEGASNETVWPLEFGVEFVERPRVGSCSRNEIAWFSGVGGSVVRSGGEPHPEL